MQRLGAKALVGSALALVTAGAVGGTGCTAKPPTELVPGVSSQMVVPKDLTGVSIQVTANGAQVFCRGYAVSPETHVVELPTTLGVVPATSPSTVVTITVRGYDSDTTSADWDDCSAGVNEANNTDGVNPPRILRRSTQTYVDQHTLFLSMPLSYSCIDVDCTGANQTCKGNQCVDATTDQTTLPDFDPTLIDGTGLCFSPSECFPSGITFPAAVVDPSQCIYTMPGYASSIASPSQVNVRVYYQDKTWQQNTSSSAKNTYEQVIKNSGELEILNADPANCGQTGAPACEGYKVLGGSTDGGVSDVHASADATFSIPDASADAGSLSYDPSAVRIQLAPGLCNLVQAGISGPPAPTTGTLTYHTISDIQISSVCAPKLPLLPICSSERNNNPVLPDAGSTSDGVCNVGVPLTPAPSVLYLVMDQTAVMHGALGPGGSVTELALSFSDPVFKRTYAGFQYVPNNDQGNSCTSATTPYTTPVVPACTGGGNCPFNVITSIQTDVATVLGKWTPPANEITAASDGGTIVCYADSDCVTAGAGTYCSKPNPVVPEGGVALGDGGLGEDAGGAEDGGEDAAVLTPGVCTNPQALDLAGAMRLDVGAYAQVLGAAAPLPTPAVAGVMFFVNRAPETALGTPAAAADGGVGQDSGVADGGSGVPAFPSPIGALDCPAAPPNTALSAATPGDVSTLPAEALASQQLLESEALNAYNSAQSLQTYFVVLDNDRHDKTALQFFQQMQTDLVQPNGSQPIITLDTTDVSQGVLSSGNSSSIAAAKNELTAFTSIITKLGTCLYEIPQTEGLTATSAPGSIKIQYSQAVPPGTVLPPGANPPVTIPYDMTCSLAETLGDAGTANGWNFDNGRIRVCGASCDNLRSAVQTATAFGFVPGGTPLDVPVYMTPLCSAGSSSGGSDATTGDQ